jgi:tRNA G18 (ribose-2'-O)-methylase SpoU
MSAAPLPPALPQQPQDGGAATTNVDEGSLTPNSQPHDASLEPRRDGDNDQQDDDVDDTADRDANDADANTEPPSCSPASFVIVYNLAKKHNIGNLLRSCTAFGVSAACLVGRPDFNGFGAHGAAEHVPLRHYPTLDECVADLKQRDGARVVGVEIDSTALPVHTHAAFTGPTAFMLGNEGDGLSARQLRLCDSLVYIPQHGPGTASLNVTVAASIVLHQFSVWARYPERARQGQKYVVGPRPRRTAPRGIVPGARPARPDAEEAARAQREGEAWLMAAAGGGGLEAVLSGAVV